MSTPDESALLITLARAVFSLAQGEHRDDIEAALAKFSVPPEKPKPEADETDDAADHDPATKAKLEEINKVPEKWAAPKAAGPQLEPPPNLSPAPAPTPLAAAPVRTTSDEGGEG